MSMSDGTAFGRPFWPGIAFSTGSRNPGVSELNSSYNDAIGDTRRARWLNPAENTKVYLYLKAYQWKDLYVNDNVEPSSPTNPNDSNYDWSDLRTITDWCASKNIKVYLRLKLEGSPIPGFVDQVQSTQAVPAFHKTVMQNQMKNFMQALHSEFGSAITIFNFGEVSAVGVPDADKDDFLDGRVNVVRHAYNNFTSWTIIVTQATGVHKNVNDIPIGSHMADPKLGNGGCGSTNTPFPVYDCSAGSVWGYMQYRNGSVENPILGVPRVVSAGSEANGWKVVDGPHSCHSPWGRCLPVPSETDNSGSGTVGGSWPRNISPSVFLWFSSGPPRAPAPNNNSNLGQSGPDNGGVIPAHIAIMQSGDPDAWDLAFRRFGWNNGQGTNAFPALPYDWLDGSPPVIQIRNDSLPDVDQNAAAFNVAHSTLLANDTGTNLTLTSVSNAAGCTAVISGSNVVVTVNVNYVGTASFQYSASGDEGTGSAVASFIVQSVTPGTNPTALDDILASVNRNSTAITITANRLLSNDTGSALQVVSVTDIVGCTVSLDVCAEEITFQPVANFTGSATFQYTVASDEPEWTDTATVTVPVVAGPDFIAYPDTLPTLQKNNAGLIDIPASTLLANDVGTNLTITSVTPVNGCAVVFNASTQVISYGPTFGFSGTARFQYTMSGDEGIAFSTASFTVVNTRPVANTPNAQIVTIGDTLVFQLSGSDADNDPLTYVLNTPPLSGQGAVLISPSGVVTYNTASMNTPQRVTSISFYVDDGEETSLAKSLDIEVIAVDSGRRIVTQDDTDATITGAGWELLSAAGGTGLQYGGVEGTDFYVNTSPTPVTLHTVTIPASVPVGSTLLFIAACNASVDGHISLVDKAGWTRFSSSKTNVMFRVWYRTVLAGDPGTTVSALRGEDRPFVSTFIVLPEGSQPLNEATANGFGDTATLPSITPTQDGAILFGLVVRQGVNLTEDTHTPTGMSSLFDRWTLSEDYADGCQMSVGFLVQDTASLYSAGSVYLDVEDGWDGGVVAFSLSGGGSQGIPFTGAYNGDAYTHAADPGGDYLEYTTTSSLAKTDLVVKASWPNITTEAVEAVFQLTVGTQVFTEARFQQNDTGGSDVVIYDEPVAPTGDISLKVSVTNDARALADKITFDFIEVQQQTTTRLKASTANAFLKKRRARTAIANAIVLAAGEAVETYVKTVTANAIIEGTEFSEWETVYKDGDTWVQRVAD